MCSQQVLCMNECLNVSCVMCRSLCSYANAIGSKTQHFPNDCVTKRSVVPTVYTQTGSRLNFQVEHRHTV